MSTPATPEIPEPDGFERAAHAVWLAIAIIELCWIVNVRCEDRPRRWCLARAPRVRRRWGEWSPVAAWRANREAPFVVWEAWEALRTADES